MNTDIIPAKIPLERAREVAGRVRAALAPHCEVCEIAGSIRRRCSEVGDVDLVVLPKAGNGGAEARRVLASLGRVMKDGAQYVVVEMPDGAQLDVWFARAERSDMFEHVPCNAGAVLLTRTGSREHNIAIVQRAKALGLRYHPQMGLMNSSGEVVASESEGEIFDALGLEFVAPENRCDCRHWKFTGKRGAE